MKIFFTKKDGWQVDVTIDGKRIREKDFPSKKAADEFVVELREQSRRRRYGLDKRVAAVLLSDLGESYLATLGKGRSQRQARQIIERFLKMFPAGTLAADVVSGDYHRFLARLRTSNKNLQPATANRYVTFVRAMFRDAPKFFREIDAEHWQPPKFKREKTRRRGSERVVSKDESDALLQALRFPPLMVWRAGKERRQRTGTIKARRDVADCFEIGLNTGMRPGEVRKLVWSQIDFTAAEIHLSDSKTGDPGDVPMNRRVAEILMRRKSASSSRFVFPNKKGTGPRPDIARVMRPVARELGLEYGRAFENGFTPHSQRHTAATNLLRRGHDMATVQSILRHSNTTMTLHYAHASHASRRRAVEDLGDSPETPDGPQVVKKSTGVFRE